MKRGLEDEKSGDGVKSREGGSRRQRMSRIERDSPMNRGLMVERRVEDGNGSRMERG
jgi:hypothetical protein